ncbi:MAG: sialidase family protein, partial [Pirellulaceae bacterium]|nr:sialidase family protein [Pirellulaceae bacterium]
WYATGPGNAIQLTKGKHKGRLVIPCDHRVQSISDRRKSTRSHIVYSDDHGRTWKIGGITEYLMNECAVAERADGTLLLNMRSNRGLHRRAIATSDDGGLTWSKCTEDDALIEPVCQGNLIRLTWPSAGVKSRLLFSNPASESQRANLTVRLSYDEGRTWPVARQLYAGSAAYSCLAPLPAGDAVVLFERDNYRAITFARLAKEWLEP